MKKKFLIFGSPLIESPEINEVIKCLKSGWIGTGPRVKQFEENFKKFKGAKFAVAVNSCSAALHLSMLAVGIKPGDEVIVPAMTFAATANAVIHAGARPVLADCQRNTMNIDPDDIKRKITRKTKAIIPVYFAGRPCEMETILKIARRHRLKIIEDCAHAVEAEYRGRKIGTFGDIGCFSFYVTKNITTGEGGMVITNKKEYADRIKVLAQHGLSQDAWRRFSDSGYKHYQVVAAGFKYNMMDIQAALGIHQLKRVDSYWRRRSRIWEKYQNAFRNLPVFLPDKVAPQNRHAYHLYTLLLDLENLKITRDQFINEMTRRKIGVGVHYTALNLHPFYQKSFGYKKGDFPVSEWISERTVSLPLSPKLTDADVNRVINAVQTIITAGKK